MNNMLNTFKIKQGLSKHLFDKNGNVKSNIILEPGAWYLCTDTACVYVCSIDLDTNLPVLKRLNGEAFDSRVDGLTERVEYVEKNSLDYVKINSMDELPKDFDNEDFNPKIIYYIEVDSEKHYIDTYIFDEDAKCYMCSRSSSSGTSGSPEVDLDEMINLLHGGTAAGL
jgi:hypothetical protein